MPDIHHKEPKGLSIQAARSMVKWSTPPPAKSGVPALDRDEEDEDWDLIEADGEEGNWARG